MAVSEELANKFKKEVVDFLDELYSSNEYMKGTPKVFKSMATTFQNCQDKCKENSDENCMTECLDPFFKGVESEMQDIYNKFLECETKCDSSLVSDRFKCFKTCAWQPLLRTGVIMSMNILAQKASEMMNKGTPPNE